jgi:uncharacterized membrane protein
MTPLLLLLSGFGILFLVNRFLLKGKLSLSFRGRCAMAFMLLFTGTAHFTNTAEMVQMLPGFIPLKQETIYLTGIIELAAAAGLVWDKFSRATSILLIIFFLAILPANIIGSLKQVQLGGMEQGATYLFFRVPLQLFFIGWVYYFGIKLAAKPH